MGQDNKGNEKPYWGQKQPQYSGGNGQRRENNTPKYEESKKFFEKLNYNSEWITRGADPCMIVFAEEAGRFMAENKLSNSKIRSIYGEMIRIKMGQFEKEKSYFYLLKPKVAYALVRDKTEGLSLFKLIFDKCSENVKNQNHFLNFCNLIEAILAYHKANDGND